MQQMCGLTAHLIHVSALILFCSKVSLLWWPSTCGQQVNVTTKRHALLVLNMPRSIGDIFRKSIPIRRETMLPNVRCLCLREVVHCYITSIGELAKGKLDRNRQGTEPCRSACCRGSTSRGSKVFRLANAVRIRKTMHLLPPSSSSCRCIHAVRRDARGPDCIYIELGYSIIRTIPPNDLAGRFFLNCALTTPELPVMSC